MGDDSSDTLHDVETYQKTVLLYEAVQKKINVLITTSGGGTEQMSPEDRSRYRELARQRDELQNELRFMEQRLLMDDEDA